MTDVKGKWAFITGASRGLGYLTAEFMAKRGCNLILHSRNKEHTQKAAEQLKATGVEVHCVSAELSDLDAVKNMLHEIDSLGKQIDIVMNNAGLQIAYRNNYLETPVEDFTVSYAVNTIAPILICYHFLPKMIKAGFGRIINTTSGISLDPQQAGYSASKAALDKLTIDLGSKVEGTNVTINLADPGWCRTDLGGPQAPNAPESVIPGITLGAFLDDKKSGRIIPAQMFSGMTLEEAVQKAGTEIVSPYSKGC